MKKLASKITLASMLAFSLTLSACSVGGNNSSTTNSTTNNSNDNAQSNNTSNNDRPGKVSNEIIYTQSSSGGKQYSGSEITITGSINGKDIGKIGTITSDGKLNLDIPDTIPDDKLDTRQGSDVKGGTLTIFPNIHPWKNDTNSLVLVYVSKDLGDYKQGWNYANSNHKMVTSTSDYKWVLIDNDK